MSVNDGRRGRLFTIAAAIAALLGATEPVHAQRAQGIDISAHQGNILNSNWIDIFGGGRQFAFIRSSRGGTTGEDHRQGGYSAPNNTFFNLSQRYDDPYFVQNVNRATAVGIFTGAYHRSRADILAGTLNSDGLTTAGVDNNGTDEGAHFLQMAGAWMRPGYLLPVLDFEDGNTQRNTADLSAFAVAFSDAIFASKGIRPIIYANSSYVNDEVNSSVAISMPNLWIARPAGAVDPLTGQPPPALPTYPNVYGRWNPTYPTIPNPEPWKFWQYSTSGGIPGFAGNIDKDVAQGGIEYVKDFLVPAMWMNNSSGDWSTLANWNSGQAPVAPISSPGQLTPIGTQTLPAQRLPGAAGSGPTSGQHDTVILDRTSANITVTLSTGTHSIRKLLMRESLNITGGSLSINYDPATWDSPFMSALPVSAQFSGAVSLGGSGSLSVHTLQVDTLRTFTLAGSSGTLTFNKITLMPHVTTPAKIAVTGDVNINPLSNATATIANGTGAGNSGLVDLGGAVRQFNVGNGSADVDLSVDVPIINGGLTKTGAGTMRLGGNNTFSGAVTINGGVLRMQHSSGLSNSSLVTVNNGGTWDINGVTDAVAGLASTAGNTTGIVTQGAAGLTLNAAGAVNDYAGTINGSGAFAKNGTYTQILSGNNTLGPVALNAGSLFFNGANATGAVTVNGGTLGGTGSVSGAVTVNAEGHVSPGASIESFDVGALTLQSGSVLDFELGAPSVSDLLNVTGLLTISGGTVNLSDAGGLAPGSYNLVDYGTLSGDIIGLGTPNGPAGFKYSLSDDGSIISLLVTDLLPGDFNADGTVDAADYIVWRKNSGAEVDLPNDNNIGGAVGQAHYDLWSANFGQTAAGSGSAIASSAAVPEPASLALWMFAGSALWLANCRRLRPRG